MTTIHLGYMDITLELDGEGGGTISSDMHEDADPEVEGGSESDTNYDRFEAGVDAMESLILGHACAGVDVASVAYVEGIKTAYEAIGQNFS